ncbi:MAG TPA: rhomboid family intramembrane serine protease [Desulfobacteraceae bacterium]|nr:rhomboid family intramembrane serine protease [Desulfobacteraceae bacterium]
MIPIRDTVQSRTYPVVNMLIIGVNVLVYFYQLSLGQNVEQLIVTYGLIPARYTVGEIAAYFTASQQIAAMFSFMFLHGGLWHLIGNMWSLYIFGDNVEDRVGHFRYLVFYILCGLVSGFSHLALNWKSPIPTVGASGAIAGVMGAYFLLYPGARILTLIPIFFIPWFIEIPAFFFLGIWFVLQFLNAAGTPAHGAGVAWWAHIGGFLCGVVLLKTLFQPAAAGPKQSDGGLSRRRHTHHLQTVHTAGERATADLKGTISVTPLEAERGALKLVNLPWGFHSRLIKVRIPPETRDGATVRLKGMGRKRADGTSGDVYLNVRIS